MISIGIDLGGTKTEIVVLDLNSSEVLLQKRVASPQHDYEATILNIKHLVVEAEEMLQKTLPIGIGMPGSLSPSTQLVRNSNSVWLNDQPIKKDLEIALKREVLIDNDANCLALSEARDGAGKNHTSVFGVIIGTGCGGGLVINGKIMQGHNRLAGEWGHNPLPYPLVYAEDSSTELFDNHYKMEISTPYKSRKPLTYFTTNKLLSEWPGAQCYCGKRGCLETWISGSGLQRDHFTVNGEKLIAEEIVKLAKSDYPENLLAQATLDRFYERLAKSLAEIINTLDPDSIVLGGGLSNLEDIYTEVPKRWLSYVFSTECTTRLMAAKFGDSSGVRGAAYLTIGNSN